MRMTGAAAQRERYPIETQQQQQQQYKKKKKKKKKKKNTLSQRRRYSQCQNQMLPYFNGYFSGLFQIDL